MEKNEPIPSAIARFIITSIDSVPHLEALLLFRLGTEAEWDAKIMAQRLYIAEKRATEILEDLYSAGFVARQGNAPHSYRYEPTSVELKEMIESLADIYAKNLLEVTHLIHSKIDKQAREFGDAFKWRKRKEL